MPCQWKKLINISWNTEMINSKITFNDFQPRSFSYFGAWMYNSNSPFTWVLAYTIERVCEVEISSFTYTFVSSLGWRREEAKHNNKPLVESFSASRSMPMSIVVEVFEKRAISAGYHKKSWWIARDWRFLEGFLLFFPLLLCSTR